MKWLMLGLVWCAISCATPSKIGIETYNRQTLKKRTFLYFWELADKQNFQIPDRYPSLTFSSIAATGFGLSAYIVGIEDKFISRAEGSNRVLQTLRFLSALPQSADPKNASGFQGFFYHFLNLDDAKRFKNVELSSIDTGLLMAGILSCMSYFDANNDTEKEIRSLADNLYRKVNWKWMMKSNGLMSMGWHPESGFIDSEWSGYNEAMVLLIMALGSPTHAIEDDAWSKWCSKYELKQYYGQNFIQFDPLFGHQYSHIWVDFRGIRDSVMTALQSDYFLNSKYATLANRAYCMDNPQKFEGYGPNCWGLTACDGPINEKIKIGNRSIQFFDYRARGASAIQVVDDGTIAPTAAGGSFPFTPIESEACLANMWNNYYTDLVGTYGFKDAFNLTFRNDKNERGWFDIDYLGIDQGPIVLQIANHENETLWKIMKKNPYIIRGLQRAGFTGGWLSKNNKN